jgi:hypothetical protein
MHSQKRKTQKSITNKMKEKNIITISLIPMIINPVYCAPEVETLNKVDWSSWIGPTTQSIILIGGVFISAYMISKGVKVLSKWWFGSKPDGSMGGITPDTISPSSTGFSQMGPAPSLEELEERLRRLREPIAETPRSVEEVSEIDLVSPVSEVPSKIIESGFTSLRDHGIIVEKITPETLHSQVLDPQTDLLEKVATALYNNEGLVEALSRKILWYKNQYSYIYYTETNGDVITYEHAYKQLENLFSLYKNHEIEQEIFIEGYLRACEILNKLAHASNLNNLAEINQNVELNQYGVDLILKIFTDPALIDGKILWEESQNLITYLDVASYLAYCASSPMFH